MKLYKLFWIYIPLFFLFFLKTNKVFADSIVINEFLAEPSSSQWVEIYNKGPDAVDIGGWVIDDNGGTEKFTIPSETLIQSHEFKVFESSLFNFNTKTADEAKLLSAGNIIDSYSYKKSPGENKSFGRKKDGEDEWVAFENPTKGSTNNFSIPMPTETPTPTPSFTPTPSPKPTTTLKPTVTLKPNTTETIITKTSIKIITPTFSSTEKINKSFSSLVLGDSESPREATKASVKKSPTPVVRVLSESRKDYSRILIAIGVIFIVICSILTVYKFKFHKKSNDE